MGTYTPNLNLYKPALGEFASSYWSLVNTNFDILDALTEGKRPYKYVVAQDGTGDYTTITAALTALGTNPGQIKVREGTYTSETYPLILYPFQELIGAGVDSTIIKPSVTLSTGRVILLSYLTIQGINTTPWIRVTDLTIDGSSTTGDVIGIDHPSGEDLWCRVATTGYQDICAAGYGVDQTRKILERVKVWNMSGRGISIVGEGNISFVMVEATQNRKTGFYFGVWNVHGTLYSCIAAWNGRSNMENNNFGFHLANAQAVMFVNCFGVLNQGHNFYAKATTPGSSDQLQMIGCIFEGSIAGDGVYIDGYNNARITNNFVSNPTTVNTAAMRLYNLNRAIITENSIEAGYDGMYIQDCSHSTIAFNGFNDGGISHDSLYVNKGISSTNLTFICNDTADYVWNVMPNNTIRIINEVATGYGISLTAITDAFNYCTFHLLPNGNISRNIDSKLVVWA